MWLAAEVGLSVHVPTLHTAESASSKKEVQLGPPARRLLSMISNVRTYDPFAVRKSSSRRRNEQTALSYLFCSLYFSWYTEAMCPAVEVGLSVHVPTLHTAASASSQNEVQLGPPARRLPLVRAMHADPQADTDFSD